MCFEFPTVDVQTITYRGVERIVGLKKFTLNKNGVYPRYMKNIPYRTRKQEIGVEFSEAVKTRQAVIYSIRNQRGELTNSMHRRKTQIGMHARLYSEQLIEECEGRFYPILINLHKVVMLTKDRITMSSFIVPTEKVVKKILKETEISQEFLNSTDEVFFALKFHYLMQSEPEKVQIELIDRNRDLYKVEATRFGGEWAAHKELHSHDYTVTHIPTKRSVGAIGSEFDANLLALRLTKELSGYTEDIYENRKLAAEVMPKLTNIMSSLGYRR